MIIFVIKLLNILLPISYIAATISYGLYFFREHPFFKKNLSTFIAVSISLHIIYTLLRTIPFNHFPITSLFELLSILALATVIIYFYIEYRIGLKSTGFFILIIVSLFQALSSTHITYTSEAIPILRSVYVVIHTMSAAFGYAAFSIATLYGIMYLMLYHEIKSRHFGIVYKRLPSLEQLDEMNFKASSTGFLFMTFSLIIGGIWLLKVIGDTSIFDSKIIVAIFIWTIFGVNCLVKKLFRRGGIITSYLSVFGFLIIIFSMVVVNIFLPTFHLFY